MISFSISIIFWSSCWFLIKICLIDAYFSTLSINGSLAYTNLDGTDITNPESHVELRENNQTGELEFNSAPDFELKDSYEIELVVNDVRSFVSIGDPGISPGGVYAHYKFEGNGTNETDNVNDPLDTDLSLDLYKEVNIRHIICQKLLKQ